MNIYAISDLHLALNTNKPMDIFGENWENHINKINKDWLSKVKEDDIVLMPGDLSWATYLKDTLDDFKFLETLPGKKILLKGNHDYWWTTLNSMNNFLKENNIKSVQFIHNNSIICEDFAIVGTRGWSIDDNKLLAREQMRLELSIKDALNKNYKEMICMMHFPPTVEFIDILKKYNIKICIYGHLHSEGINNKLPDQIDGIKFTLASCDSTDFKLVKIK